MGSEIDRQEMVNAFTHQGRHQEKLGLPGSLAEQCMHGHPDGVGTDCAQRTFNSLSYPGAELGGATYSCHSSAFSRRARAIDSLVETMILCSFRYSVKTLTNTG